MRVQAYPSTAVALQNLTEGDRSLCARICRSAIPTWGASAQIGGA
jgi:hypothetical protein